MNKYVFEKFYNEIDYLLTNQAFYIDNPKQAIDVALVHVDVTKDFELAIFDIEINKGNVDVSKIYSSKSAIAYKLTEQGKEALNIFIL